MQGAYVVSGVACASVSRRPKQVHIGCGSFCPPVALPRPGPEGPGTDGDEASPSGRLSGSRASLWVQRASIQPPHRGLCSHRCPGPWPRVWPHGSTSMRSCLVVLVLVDRISFSFSLSRVDCLVEADQVPGTHEHERVKRQSTTTGEHADEHVHRHALIAGAFTRPAVSSGSVPARG